MEKEKFNYKSKINYDDFVQYAKLNKNIKYGNLETAMYYCERNKIGKWINRSL